MMADRPYGTYLRRNSEMSRGITGRKHFEWTCMTRMIKANEGVIHSSGKSFPYVMLTDPLIMYGRIMVFTEF